MAMPVGGQKGVTFSWTDASEGPRLCTRTPLSRKKRGGFCRPPRQLYPQEERGIQRPKYRAFCQCVATCVTPQPARVNGKNLPTLFPRNPLRRIKISARLATVIDYKNASTSHGFACRRSHDSYNEPRLPGTTRHARRLQSSRQRFSAAKTWKSSSKF